MPIEGAREILLEGSSNLLLITCIRGTIRRTHIMQEMNGVYCYHDMTQYEMIAVLGHCKTILVWGQPGRMR